MMTKRLHKFGTVLLTMTILWSCGKDDATAPEPEPKNTAPILNNQTFDVDENIEAKESFAVIAAEDAEEDALTFSLTKDESNLFSVSGNGSISLVEGASLDFETVEEHSLTVRVSDGNSNASGIITISVQNINEPQKFEDDVQFEVPENIADSFVIGTATATDPENDALTYSISENDNGLFEITEDGKLSLAKDQMLDFEVTASHEITVSATDGEQSASALITINVNKVDPENTVPTMENQSFEVNENIDASVAFATIVAEDAEDDELIYSLTSDESENFAISDNGEISLVVGASLDFETIEEYNITVQVTDGNLSTDATMTISVKDVNETPVTDQELQFNVLEDINNAFIIGTVMATDPDNDVLNYSISENDNQLFEINENGEISLASNQILDYESQTEHIIQVAVADDEFMVYVDVTITVENVMDSLAEDSNSFITEWETNAPNEGVAIQVYGNTDFQIDWGDGSEIEIVNAEGELVHNYQSSGVYTVAIKGQVDRLSFLDQIALGTLEQWGTIAWKSMESMFQNTNISISNNAGIPNLSQCTSTRSMFQGCTTFNDDIGMWDLSNVSNTSFMFSGATSFNANISNWNTAQVTDMSSMFETASAFDQNLGNWNIANMETMANMLDNSGMTYTSANATLVGWANYVDLNGGPTNINCGMLGITVCGGEVNWAGGLLVNDNGWQIPGVNNQFDCP